MHLHSWIGAISDGRHRPFSMLADGAEPVWRAVRADALGMDDAGAERKIAFEADGLEAALILNPSPVREDPSPFLSFHVVLRLEKDRPMRISGIHVLDAALPQTREEEAGLLCGLTGGFWDLGPFPPASLRYWERTIGAGDTFLLDSDRSGRSSNSQLPLWVYAAEGQALWFGVEWSGCWSLQVERASRDTRISLGLPTFDFLIQPGETIRLPGITLGTATGGPEEGMNALRRIARERMLPDIAGRRPTPPVVFQGLGGMPSFEDEPTLYREAELAAEIGCEAFVLDAGWYMSPASEEWFEQIGGWQPHPERFPRGMDRFARHVKKLGMRFGLWWEPRAKCSAPGFEEQAPLLLAPDAAGLDLLRRQYGAEEVLAWGNLHMLDLSRRDAQEYAIALLERFIVELGADWIWFDFNTDPRTVFWDAYEEPQRRGLMELGFYQGLYRVFEEIHARHPDVWLETCASGGRCIDLAMLRRFHSIWINDGSFEDDGSRNLRSGANRFLPAVCLQQTLFIRGEALQGEGPRGDIHFLTHFGGVFQLAQGLTFWRPSDVQRARELVAIYKEIRHYLEGDFYALFPQPQSLNGWDGWQYHDRKTGCGILLLFRLAESDEPCREIALGGMGAPAIGELRKVAGQGRIEAAGETITVHLGKNEAMLAEYALRA